MKRRFKQSTIVALVLALLLAASLALLLQFRNSWLASRLAGLATQNLLADSGYAMSLEGVGWKPGEGFQLRGLSLRYRGDLREPFVLFEAERLRMSLRPRALLKGNLSSPSLEIEGAVLRAFPVPSEGWAYPGLGERGGEPSRSRVDLESIGIRDFLLLRPAGQGLDSLRVDLARMDFHRSGAGLRLGIDSLAGRLPSGQAVESLSGRLRLAEQVLDLDSLRFRLPDGSGLLAARVHLGGKRSLELSGRADSLRLDEVAALWGEKLETDSRLSGTFSLSGRTDSLRIAGRVSGSLYDYELENLDLSGRLGPGGRLEFRTARGRVNRNPVDGKALFLLPHPGEVLGMKLQTRLVHFDLASFLGDGPPSDLNGRVRIEGDENKLDLGLDLGAGSFLDLPFASGQADLGLAGDSLALRRVDLRDRGLALDLQGWLRPGAGDLDLRGVGSSRSSRLARIFSGDSTLTGDLDFNLRVHGALEAPVFEMNGPFRHAVFLGAAIDSGRVELACPALNRDPLDVVLEAKSVSYWKFKFNKGFVHARVFPDSLELAYASLEGESLGLTLAGGLPLRADPPRARFTRFWVHSLGEDWLNDRPLVLEWGPSPRVEAVQMLSSSGRVSLQWGRPEGEPRSVEWEDLNLSLLRPWLPAGLASSGRSRGSLLLDSRDRVDLRVELDDLRLGAQADGRSSLSARWESDSLRLESLDWRLSDGGFLKAEGRFGGLPTPARLLAGKASLSRDSLTLDLDLRCDRFPTERLDAFLPDSTGIHGRLNGGLHLHGPFGSPSLESEAELDSFRLGPLSLDEIRWVASSDGRALSLHSLSASMGSGSRLEGHLNLPVELSLLSAPRLEPQGPLEGELDLQGRLEDFHPLLNPWLAVAEGDLEARVALAGTVEDPRPRGRVKLRRAKLRPMAWEEELVGLDADGRLEGDSLFIENLSAREGLRFEGDRLGRVQAGGWLTWRGPFHYEAKASVTQFSLNTLPFFTGVLSGELTLKTGLDDGQREFPLLEGRFKVSRGELHKLLEQSAAASEEPPPVSYRLDLSSDGGLYLRDAEADLELAGDLTVSSLPSGKDISGLLDIRRGRYTLFWHVFHLKEGTLDFNRSKGFNPGLSIEAETRTRDDVITLDITGTLEEPKVGVKSSQGYNEEDVLRILVGAPQGDEGWTRSTGEAVGGTVSNQLLGRLESWASGELFSGLFDTVEIEGANPLSGEGTRWQVGRYLPGGFYVTYNHGLSLNSTWELGMENRLLSWMILRMELINRGEELGSGTSQGEYNFDIRFRYEY